MLLMLLAIVTWLIGLYSDVLFIRVIIDWVLYLVPRFRPGTIISAIINVFYVLTDPPLRWLRRYVPAVRLGRVGLDISPLILWFILDVIVFLLRIVMRIVI